MAIQINLIENRMPVFDFRLPLPETCIDHLEFKFEGDKLGTILFLKIKIIYSIENFDTKERYEVAQFRSVYEITPLDETLTSAKLYPACKYATDMLNSCLGFLIDAGEVPERTISCPPICHLQGELHKVMRLYDSEETLTNPE